MSDTDRDDLSMPEWKWGYSGHSQAWVCDTCGVIYPLSNEAYKRSAFLRGSHDLKDCVLELVHRISVLEEG